MIKKIIYILFISFLIMNIRNHAPMLILRILWEKPGHKCCEPGPVFDLSCTHPCPSLK